MVGTGCVVAKFFLHPMYKCIAVDPGELAVARVGGGQQKGRLHKRVETLAEIVELGMERIHLYAPSGLECKKL
jgi:hypothetical protein